MTIKKLRPLKKIQEYWLSYDPGGYLPSLERNYARLWESRKLLLDILGGRRKRRCASCQQDFPLSFHFTCKDCWRQWKGCRKKRAYKTKLHAQGIRWVLRIINYMDLIPYRCRYDNHWHLATRRDRGAVIGVVE